MKPEKFKEIWEATGDPLCQFSESDLESTPLPRDAYVFLIKAGLPKEAAPFLNFSATANKWLLQVTRNELAEKYFSIGSNGYGDPVVISSDGEVFYLDHDRGFAPRYVNQNVAIFAESLVRFRSLILETLRINGPDAFLDGNVSAHLGEEFTRYLEAVDPRSLKPDSMWSQELQTL